MEEANICEIDRLPEGCIAHVLSFTSPSDTCCAATMSRKFRTAADSNTVWGEFLPPDYLQILTRAVEPVTFDSCRELYFKLCDQPVLIDDGTKLFSLMRETGAKCVTVLARELSKVRWLEVFRGISSRELTPYTTYGAYLIFKIKKEAYGLRFPTQEVSVGLGTQISSRRVMFNPNERGEYDILPEMQVPQVRSDGWLEVVLGQFYRDDGNEGDVSITFKHSNFYWCGGLVIQAVQFRPV